MTDREVMYHRFQSGHIKKHTGLLAEMLGMSRQDYEAAVIRGMAEEAAELRSKHRNENELNEAVEYEESDGRRIMTREEFVDIVRNELQSYGDCYLADRIIAAADKYAEGRTSWIPVSEDLPPLKDSAVEISDDVLVTDGNDTYVGYLKRRGGKTSWHIYEDVNIDIVAWMPSPEQYKAESEEAKDESQVKRVTKRTR